MSPALSANTTLNQLNTHATARSTPRFLKNTCRASMTLAALCLVMCMLPSCAQAYSMVANKTVMRAPLSLDDALEYLSEQRFENE